MHTKTPTSLLRTLPLLISLTSLTTHVHAQFCSVTTGTSEVPWGTTTTLGCYPTSLGCVLETSTSLIQHGTTTFASCVHPACTMTTQEKLITEPWHGTTTTVGCSPSTCTLTQTTSHIRTPWAGTTTLAMCVPTATAGPPAPLWGQCGGQGFIGPSTCEQGAQCVYVNTWFSQCHPFSCFYLADHE